MKTIKIIMAIIAMAAATAANAQVDDLPKDYLDFISIQNTEWNTMSFDDSDKISFLLSSNKYHSSFAKIVVVSGDNSTMVMISDINCEYIASLNLKIGDFAFPLRKITKGQTKGNDTFYARFVDLSRTKGMLWSLLQVNAKTGTVIMINRNFDHLLKKETAISLEVPFEKEKFSYLFTPTKPVK